MNANPACFSGPDGYLSFQLKIKHLNGNSTYGVEQSQTALLLAVFQLT